MSDEFVFYFYNFIYLLMEFLYNYGMLVIKKVGLDRNFEKKCIFILFKMKCFNL